MSDSKYMHPGVYMEEVASGPVPIEGVSTSIVGFIGQTLEGDKYQAPGDDTAEDLTNKAVLITSYDDFTAKFGGYDAKKAPYLPFAVQGFFLNGGGTCYVVKVPDLKNAVPSGAPPEDPGQRTGVHALLNVDEAVISLICIPGLTDPATQQALLDFCKTEMYYFCILDGPGDPANKKPPQIQDVIGDKYRQKLSCDVGYGAVYFPWIQISVLMPDPDTGTPKPQKFWVPPSGYVAGVYARTDTNRGVFKAPANEEIQGVLGLQVRIDDKIQDLLNPQSINCIRFFPGRNFRIWGARTIYLNELWRYVPVRRLFIYLEDSLYKGTQWAVFEPNDERLWSRVIQSITQFLKQAWINGALLGETPDKAFFVKCGLGVTMNETDLEMGRLIIEVGVAPVRPAEFVIIRIQQQVQPA